MATIVPFRGILYDKNKVGEVENVVAPPYDVISEEKQHALYDRHDRNVIRLILGKMHPGDSGENNRHTRAARCFNDWQDEGVLYRDEIPALYLSSVAFTVEGKTIVRYGLIAGVRLETFDKGIILPHEQTFSKVKSERLSLMKICKANFSQIFSIYSDQAGILETLKAAVAGKEPDIDLTDDAGERHCLWKITDLSVIETVQERMADKCLYIADGHHRYETALNYRDFLKETDPGFSEKHPANAIMMYLTSMEDPGLIIFPTHRLLNTVDEQKMSSLVERAREYFDVETLPFTEPFDEGFIRFRKILAQGSEKTTIGVVIKQQKAFYLFSVMPGVMDQKFADVIPASLQKLDVTVLTHLILLDLLGMAQAELDQEKLITYSENDRHAVNSVCEGRCEAAFILNPTRIEQVRDIAEDGQTMPRKTTYFYPKALTGLVFNTLKP